MRAKRITLCLLLSIMSCTLFGQIKEGTISVNRVCLDNIKDDGGELGSKYIELIQRPKGWRHDAKYYYEGDSLSPDTSVFDVVVKFTPKGEFLTVMPTITGHGKYKIKDNYISLLAAKELVKTKRMKKRTWVRQRIIIVTADCLILESNSEGGIIRHVYRSN